MSLNKTIPMVVDEVKKIEHEDWMEKFKPHVNQNGELIRYWDEEAIIIAAREENKIWTQLDADGEVIITNGWHYVNRMDYFICDIPYEDDELYEVID